MDQLISVLPVIIGIFIYFISDYLKYRKSVDRLEIETKLILENQNRSIEEVKVSLKTMIARLDQMTIDITKLWNQ